MLCSLICLVHLGCLAAPVNLLPGDTGCSVGPGPFTVQSGGDGLDPALVDQAVRLPAPADLNLRGALLRLPLCPPLRADQTYTLAFRARADGGCGRLEADLRDAFGRGGRGRFEVDQSWRWCQMTFTAQAPPRDEEQAREFEVDWRRRWETVPPELVSQPLYGCSVTALGTGDGPSAVLVDDLQLVAGDTAQPAAAQPLAVDGWWSEQAMDVPLWQGARKQLWVGAVGPAGQVSATVRVTTPDGVTVLAVDLDPTAGNRWNVDLSPLGSGCYLVQLTARDGERRAAAERRLQVLQSVPPGETGLTFDPAAVSRAAPAMRLGYRQVRLASTWASLADDDGRLRVDELDRRVGPALAAGCQVILALQVTPAGAQPRRVRTGRKMDSHGPIKGTPLPDLESFLAFTRQLAGWGVGKAVVFELGDQAWLRWNAADYLEFLKRFRDTLREVDPQVQSAGMGFKLDAPGREPKPVGFYPESVKRDAQSRCERITLELPGQLGTAPEDWLGTGFEALARWCASQPALAQRLQFDGSAIGNLGPDRSDEPRAVPAGRLMSEVSPWQAAARTMRAFLLAQTAQPAAFPTGWRGGYGPTDALFNLWLTRYRGARFRQTVDLGAGLVALVFESPSGLGLAAVWDAGDDRWSAAEPRPTGGAALLLDRPRGQLLRVHSAYGRERREAYSGRQCGVALSFEPTWLEGVSPPALVRLLESAQVLGHESVRTATRLALVDGGPALAVEVANQSRTVVSGEVRVEPDRSLELLSGSQSYRLLPTEQAQLIFPAVRWLGTGLGRVDTVIEAGTRLVGGPQTLLRWPTRPRGLRRTIDGDRADWAANQSWRLATADRLLDQDADWLGPDDASARCTADYADGVLDLFCEVTDDHLATENKTPFETGDGLELVLDLDLSGDAFEPLPNADDYRLILSPVFDGEVQGRLKLVRGGGPGEPLLHDKAIQAASRAVAHGYVFEVALPLTVLGRQTVEAAGGFGFDLLLNDDDTGGGRDVRLLQFGDLRRPGLPGALANAWLGDSSTWQPPAAVSVAPEPHLLTVGFEQGGEPYRLTPGDCPSARLRRLRSTDFVRGDWLVRVEPHGEARFCEIELPPSSTGLYQLDCWVRASGTPLAPRLLADVGRARATIAPDGWWQRCRVLLPAAERKLMLTAVGEGRLELAEIVVDAVWPGPAAEPVQ